MLFKKKQYLIIFVILLTVIGIVGAGCLGNKNENNTTNNTNNSTGNTSNTSNTSNNTTNTSNNTSSNNTSNKSSDVIYANQSSGGGGGGGGKSSSSPNFVAQVLGLNMTVEEYAGVDSTNLCIYVPADEIGGEKLTLAFKSNVSNISETYNEDVITSVTSAGKIVTVDMKSGIDSDDFEKGGADPTKISFTVTIGNTVYDVYLLASSIVTFDIGSNGAVQLTDNKGTYNITGKSSGACDIGSLSFTAVPNDKYAISSFVVKEGETEVYNGTSPDVFDVGSSVSVIYEVTAAFEKAVLAEYDGGKIYLDQNLNAKNNIYVYIPAEEAAGKSLTFEFPNTVTSVTASNTDFFDSSPASSGKKVTAGIKSDVDAGDFEKGGAGNTPNPTTIAFKAVTADGTYNVYILNSAVLKVKLPANAVLLENGNALSLTAPGEYRFVADIGDDFVFTATINGGSESIKLKTGISGPESTVTTANLDDVTGITYILEVVQTPDS